MANPLLIPLWRWLRRRRFPTLLKITATVFFVNLFIPDPIPLIDDILLGLATLTLASMRRPREQDGERDGAGRTPPGD
ncbi:DUF6116 family protein [Alkalisalibacterium limincola]|uniref:Uncharacterized protein n=1 Tax=Alkalisalibacterium limincola TaxID=2699169 RepID=A0A5C8KX58_9GAMM|nr:DUF6116 family protein [Alkalisalibacterium limincola]TXK65638.1 hypothetical protein FU658_00440 [Alkalisalibacterium limincola]